jgi:hypothetical protein
MNSNVLSYRRSMSVSSSLVRVRLGSVVPVLTLVIGTEM